MSNQAIPGFGAKLRTPEYYEQIDAIISNLRPMATQRTIALHLDRAGFQTPKGHPWTRQMVATYLRKRDI